MSRRKILFITAWYPTPSQPVWGVFVREHAKAVRLYDDVAVLHCLLPEPALPQPYQTEQVSDPALTEGIPTYRVWYRAAPVSRTAYFRFLQSVNRAYQEIVAGGFRPDVLHAHIYEAGVPAVLLGKRHRLPVVITEQYSAFPRRLLSRQKVLKARWAFGQADRVLPVSASLQNAIEQYGIHARFQRVPNVVDTALFAPPFERSNVGTFQRSNVPTQILFVGSLIPLKGVGVLLEALARVQQQRQDWRLDLVGDGADREAFVRQAADLGLAPQVTFHGLKTKTEVAEFMRRADLFVLPSLWDNMPCVIVEAMASGLPIVASNVGGIPEMVDSPELGVLSPPGDVAALAEALLASLAANAQVDRPLIASRAQRFSLATVGRTLHDVYEEVLA